MSIVKTNIPNRSSSKEINNHAVINIAVLGDPKCGKTSLIECLLNEKIVERNLDTILNIYQSKFAGKNYNFSINFFDISGYFQRDKDFLIDYIKCSNIILLCHSFENDFDEESLTYWLKEIERNGQIGKSSIYLVGCKYDIKVMLDYQKGSTITTIMFENGNLANFGEKIRKFINSNFIQEYFIVSSLLNYNVKEMFQSIIKNYVIDNILINNSKTNNIDERNCIIY